MGLEFHGQYDKDYFFKAVYMANRPSKTNIIIRFILCLILGGLFVYNLIEFATSSYSNELIFRLVTRLLSFSIAIYLILLPLFSSYLTATRIWKRPEISTPLSGIISNTGIQFSNTSSVTEVQWQSFAKIRKADSLVVLVSSDGVLSIFPKHFFKNDEEWRRFQQYVDLNVKEAI